MARPTGRCFGSKSSLFVLSFVLPAFEGDGSTDTTSASFDGGAYRARTELPADDGRDSGSQNFDSTQHLLMRQRRHTHLECDARDAAEGLVHVEYFLRDSFSIADQQGTRGSAYGVELCPCSWGPTALLANLGERVRVSRIKVIRSLLGCVSRKPME
jgi:hypothetical protein